MSSSLSDPHSCVFVRLKSRLDGLLPRPASKVQRKHRTASRERREKGGQRDARLLRDDEDVQTPRCCCCRLAALAKRGIDYGLRHCQICSQFGSARNYEFDGDFLSLLYTLGHAMVYTWPVSLSMGVEALKQFHRTYYISIWLILSYIECFNFSHLLFIFYFKLLHWLFCFIIPLVVPIDIYLPSYQENHFNRPLPHCEEPDHWSRQQKNTQAQFRTLRKYWFWNQSYLPIVRSSKLIVIEPTLYETFLESPSNVEFKIIQGVLLKKTDSQSWYLL